MTGKLEYIRNNDCLLVLPCLATNATSLLDGVASDLTLEWAKLKRITLDDIEPAPKIMKE
jgi:hypothetical protein